MGSPLQSAGIRPGRIKKQRCVTFEQDADQELVDMATKLGISVAQLVREAVRIAMPRLRQQARAAGR